MSFFKHSGVELYYEVTGDGAPLLLINGLSADTRQWIPLVKRLRSTFKIINFDMRCAGRSEKPDKTFTLDEIANDARALIDHLKLENVRALGFSMGGMVAMKLALMCPEKVGKLFLIATTPSLSRPHPPSNDVMATLSRTDVSPALLTEVYDMAFGPIFKKHFSAKDFINFRMKDDNPQPAFAYLRQLEALRSCDLCDDVEKIKTKTIIIAGSEDKLIPPANSLWLNEHLAGSKLYNFEGVGHMIPVEATDQLADILIANK